MKKNISNKKKIIIAIIMLLLFAFLLFWFGSVLKCEILTHKYGAEFSAKVNNFNMMDIDYYKVIKYDSDEHEALIYCVAKRGAGITMSFRKNGNGTSWIYIEYNVIWSSSGSADVFIWPYIR